MYMRHENLNFQVKLKLLEENRLKVMRKQLLLLQNALSAYFSGISLNFIYFFKQISSLLGPSSFVMRWGLKEPRPSGFLASQCCIVLGRFVNMLLNVALLLLADLIFVVSR